MKMRATSRGLDKKLGGNNNLDSSLYGIIMRNAQPFNTRYPLVEVRGSIGDITDSETWPAARYIKGKLSPITEYLFKGIGQNGIDRWYDSYDGSHKFPTVLPCLGFWPLINGSMGIATGLSSSVPAFNLSEMNEALINLLHGRDFEMPLPDFPGGGTIINRDEVLESLQVGKGKAAMVISKIDYDAAKHRLIVTEIPPLVYTNRINDQLVEAANDPLSGVINFNDSSGREPLIYIDLDKSANPNNVIDYLYSNTSLKSAYTINLTMLDRGVPKVFGMPEAMKRYLEHQEEVYLSVYKYEKEKAEKRLHIVEGFLIAIANLEEVVAIIKNSRNSAESKLGLTKAFNLTDMQAEAILKLTLGRLNSLDVQKFVDEKKGLLDTILYANKVLTDRNELKKVIEKGLREVVTKFGDVRRTRILSLENETIRSIYHFDDGRVALTKSKTSIGLVGTSIAGQEYMAVTAGGVVMRSTEVPKRAKKVFSFPEGDKIIATFGVTEELKFIVYCTKDGTFRCKKIDTLNLGRTTLPHSDIIDAYLSPVKVTKADYKKRNTKMKN